MTPDPKAEQVAKLNDELRKYGRGGIVVVTPGVQHNPRRTEIINAIRRYDFSTAAEGNDPYGERDFMSVEVAGERYFGKIDYYDLKMEGHSEDKSDPTKTKRVLTIMRSDEY